jgi:hypothetical protein
MVWQRFGRSSAAIEMEDDMAAPGGYGLGYGQARALEIMQEQAGGSYVQVQSDTQSDSCAPMGMDRDTYNRVIVMPSSVMSIVLALLLCSMYSRYKQGKPVTPWCGCPYVPASQGGTVVEGGGMSGSAGGAGGPSGMGGSQVGGSYVSAVGAVGSVPPGSLAAALSGVPAGSMSQAGGSAYASGGPGGLPSGSTVGGPGSMMGGPGSVAGGPAAGGAPGAKKEEKAALPYERIPTPGVTPYIWSPPATIFQPSPTPPGTPFTGGSPAAGAAADDDVGPASEDGYYKGRKTTSTEDADH